MVKTRIATALVLAPLVLGLLFFTGPSTFIYFVDVVILLGAWEWARMSGIQHQLGRIAYAAVVGATLVGLRCLNADAQQMILFASVLFWIMALGTVINYPQPAPWQNKFVLFVFGFFVLLPAWIALVSLKAMAHAEIWILMLLLLVWAADIGAYFSGKRFGKNKLAPSVSPGKTREGLYGGLVAAFVVALIFAFSIEELNSGQQVYLVVLAVFIALVSVLGDLFESMIKRHAGIKDSSQLLPGHGGVLDRIDSLTAAAPIFVLGLQMLGSA